MRCFLTVIGLACLLAAAAGCQPADEQAHRPETSCDDRNEAELGLPTLDVPAHFTTTKGQLRISVTGMSPDALIPIDTTMVFLGAAGTTPHRDPQRPEWPDNGTYQVRVSLEEPGLVDVEAGSYWLVSPAGGDIFVATCPDVEVTDVVPVMPQPGAGFGVTPGGTE